MRKFFVYKEGKYENLKQVSNLRLLDSNFNKINYKGLKLPTKKLIQSI